MRWLSLSVEETMRSRSLIILLLVLAACSDTTSTSGADGSGTGGVRDRGNNPQPDGGATGDGGVLDSIEGDGVPNDLGGADTTSDDNGSIEEDRTTSDPGRVDDTHCDGESIAFTGTHVLDFNQENLEINDRLKITIFVTADPTVDESAVIAIRSTNVRYLEGTVRQDDAPFSGADFAGGGILNLNVDSLTTSEFTVEAEVVADTGLITVFVHLELVGAGCIISRSHSGAMLQVIGGEFKNPYCVDMAQFRSLQVAPLIQRRNLDHYAEQNGVRDDLWVDEFIFCPESPTIVHAAEFCIRSQSEQKVAFAGTHDGDDWTVDDFMLVEVFSRGVLTADGFTTQNHPGRDTFWCPETATNLCPDGCTAELSVLADERLIDALAVAPAEGDDDVARTFTGGDVEITSLLSADGSDRTIRITALDAGEVGELRPQIYLVSDDPE